MTDNPYIERIDGSGLLRDASGKPILADQFDDEPSERMAIFEPKTFFRNDKSQRHETFD